MQDTDLLSAPELSFELEAPSSRLDHALAAELKTRGLLVSRSWLKDLFAQGLIELDGKPARAAHVLSEGKHRVRVLSPLTQVAARPAPSGSFVPVVYEDDDVLVLHKPAGIASSPLRPEDDRTAVSSALARCPTLLALSESSLRPLEPGLLHRLDTGTSGLLCFAKNAAEFSRLRELWSSGAVGKTYLALVAPGAASASSGALPACPARIEVPLAHDEHAKKRMIALVEGEKRRFRGKPLRALTHLISARETGHGHELTVRIETGVMHQIRCHLASLGWPVQGDPIYGGKPSDRLWLHAWRLELPLASGARLKLEARLPDGWPVAV